MKRFASILLLVLVALGGSALFFFGPLIAAPPESEELTPPVVSPPVITPDVPTFVTFTTTLPDPNIRRPKLQFFDPAKGRWRTASGMRDNGKLGDEVKGDGIFTLRLRFVDVAGETLLGLVGRPRSRGEVPTPVVLRLVAKKKGQRGVVVSAPFLLSSNTPGSLQVGDGTVGPSVTVDVPDTATVGQTSTNHVRIVKPGPEGYVMTVSLRSNPGSWALEQWILACIFGPCTGLPEPGDPQTLAEYPRNLQEEQVQVAGLAGYRLSLNDLGGANTFVVLDDPENRRVIVFDVFSTDVTQQLNFEDNLSEALSIVNSLQL